MLTTLAKISFLFAVLLFAQPIYPQGVINGVVNEASVTARIIEASNRANGTTFKPYNKHRIADYYRSAAGIQAYCNDCATCAAAVWAWHLEAGIRPDLRGVAMAKSWINVPWSIRIGKGATQAKKNKVKPGMVAGYRFPRNWHVGLITETHPLYVVTSECNTSSSADIKARGQYQKIRPYDMLYSVTDWRNHATIYKDSVRLVTLRKKYKLNY